MNKTNSQMIQFSCKILPLSVLLVFMAPAVLAQENHSGHDADGNKSMSSPDPVSSALLPLPEGLRDGAMVLGYSDDGMVSILREGDNGLICLGDKPGDERFQAVCYHESLEPFMARGRELRAQGLTGRESIEKRHEEIDSGLLEAPEQGAMLYNMMMEMKDFDPATALPALYAIYTPYATEQSTGLSSQPPAPGAPWIMRSGTPSSHIMVVIPGRHDH